MEHHGTVKAPVADFRRFDPLVSLGKHTRNIKKLWNITVVHGKTHYFYLFPLGHIQ